MNESKSFQFFSFTPEQKQHMRVAGLNETDINNITEYRRSLLAKEARDKVTSGYMHTSAEPAARVEQPQREAQLLEALHEYDVLLEQLDEALASPEEIARDTKAVGGYVSGLNLTYTASTILKKAIERLAAPAAPVVEQRRPNPYIPKVALIEECMKIVENVWRENTGRDMETIAFQIAHNALGEFRNETAAKRNGWAASQRTEGEGQL